MNFELTETPEQIELIKACGSTDKIKSMNAQQALATFMGGIIQVVLNKAGFTSTIYKTTPFDDESPATLPLDLYYQQGVNSIQVWSQNTAGGLGSTHLSGLQEMPVATFSLWSAVSMFAKYARRGRIDAVAAAFNRMAGEILVKKELNGFTILLRALAEATTNGTQHIITSTVANSLQVDDFNRLITLGKRINVAFDGGTPDAMFSNGPSDLFMSHEMVEQVRGWVYQPQNTRNGATTTSGATSLALPDSVRESIFNASGLTDIYGRTIHGMNELGTGSFAYNVLFGQFATGNIAHGSTFSVSADEIVLAMDLVSNNWAFSPVGRNADSGATVSVTVDDQFQSRSGKIGWVASQELGFVIGDSRKIQGLTV